jgi:hypothetical protein
MWCCPRCKNVVRIFDAKTTVLVHDDGCEQDDGFEWDGTNRAECTEWTGTAAEASDDSDED